MHPAVLPDTHLFRELGHLYETRLETLWHGSEWACQHNRNECARWSGSTCAGTRSGRLMHGGCGRARG
jgi:hypothetical protein